MKRTNWPYILLAIMGSLLFALGIWWIYLLSFFAASSGQQGPVLNMIKWEGTTFLILLLLCGAGLVGLYIKDNKKTRALQGLFASLTHELKTPLASMQLQAEVILDLIKDKGLAPELGELANRLVQDVSRFEQELDKGLQLSRVERGGSLTMAPVELIPFVQKVAKKFQLSVKFFGDSATVMADESALAMVFRNLFENTIRHRGPSGEVSIHITADEQNVRCHYNDQGPSFSGDAKLLGTLFYKHASHQGSGIGLYLIKQLMKAQGGDLHISATPNLKFDLVFVKDLT